MARESLLAKAGRKGKELFYLAQDYHVVERPLCAEDIQKFEDYRTQRFNKNFSVKKYEKSDWPRIRQVFGAEVAERFLGKHKNAVLISDASDFVGYVAYSDELVRDENEKPFLIDIDPRPGFRYCFDGYVVPEKRSRGALLFGTMHLIARSYEEGITALFAFTKKGNAPIIKTITRMGWRITGQMQFRRVMGIVYKNIRDLGTFSALPS